MSEFGVFIQLGFNHILDWNGADHILFVIALCALFTISEWRSVLILVTSFTVGHSLTLLLVTLSILSVNVTLVEFMIPLTIFATAVSNILVAFNSGNRSTSRNFYLAGIFGLIHGMGFSAYLQALLGREERILSQLLAFNIGLELGQIIVVGIVLGLSFLAVNMLGTPKKFWRLTISSIVLVAAIVLIINTEFIQQL